MTEATTCTLCCQRTATSQVTYCELCTAQVQSIIAEIIREKQLYDNINEINILGSK